MPSCVQASGPYKARPTSQRATPEADMGSRGVGASTVPADGTDIPPRVVPSPPPRTAPVTDNEMLLHLSLDERITFGKVMQARIKVREAVIRAMLR